MPIKKFLRSRYLRHRFPPDIISHSVRLYHRDGLSFRDVEDLPAERGIIVSEEFTGSDPPRRRRRRVINTPPPLPLQARKPGGSLPVTAAIAGAAGRCPFEARFEPRLSSLPDGRRCDRAGRIGCDRRRSVPITPWSDADQVFGPAPGTWTFRRELVAVCLFALTVTIVTLRVVLTASCAKTRPF